MLLLLKLIHRLRYADLERVWFMGAIGDLENRLFILIVRLLRIFVSCLIVTGLLCLDTFFYRALIRFLPTLINGWDRRRL
jgi:hypothetical protein